MIPSYAYTANDFFANIIETNVGLTSAYSIFVLHNPTPLSVTIAIANISWFIRYNATQTTSMIMYLLRNVSYSYNITDYGQKCTNSTTPNSTMIQNCTVIISGWHWNNYTQEEFRSITEIPFVNINANGNATIKVQANYQAKLGNNYRDWVPYITFNSTNYTKTSWQWWNTSYSYKRTIMINTTGEALTNYYTANLTRVNTSLLITTGKMMSNCQDLRIVYNETTELNRSIMSCNNVLGDTWIEFKLVNPIGANINDTNYTMYYGNTSPTNNNPQNKSAIYWIGDDFNTYNTNLWTTIGGTITANGILNISCASGTGQCGIESKFKNLSMPFSLEMGNTQWVNKSGASSIIVRRQLNVTGWSSDFRAGFYCDGNNCVTSGPWLWFSTNNVPSTGETCAFGRTVLHNRTIVLYNDSLARYYENSSLICSNTSTQKINNSVNWSVNFQTWSITGIIYQYTDWVIVRKLTNTSKVPNVTLIGVEQTQIVGTTYNASGSFSLSITTTQARTYSGKRSSSLSLNESLLNSRMASLQRASSLSLNASLSNIKRYMANRLSSLSLNESLSGSRAFSGTRSSSLSLNETISSIKSAALKRSNSFSLSLSQLSSRIYHGVRASTFSLNESLVNLRTVTLNRENSLSLSLSESASRTYNAMRSTSLSLILNATGKPPYAAYKYLLSFALNLMNNADEYIARMESVNPYRICSVLQQIGTTRAYLCVYPDGTWKILIRGV